MSEHLDQVQRWPTSNRDLLTATATAVPVWNFYGFAARFFHDTWGDVAFPVLPISYGLNAGFIVLLPFLPRGGRTTLRVATALGGLMAVWSAIGMRSSPRSKLHYTAVPTLLGAATAILASRAAKDPATRA
jgi:hypothetical protein